MNDSNLSPSMIELWNYKHPGSLLCLDMGDINGDGQVEVIVGTNSGKILILSKEGKLLLERTICNDSAIFHLKLSDIDDDGKLELVVGGIDGLLRVFKFNESYEPEPDWAHQFGASISGVYVGTFIFDNKKGILCHSLDKTLRVLDPKDGSLLWGQVFEEGVAEAIIIKNPSNNSVKEVIACGNDGTLRCFSGKNGDLKWFKRYSDKMRCLSLQDPKQGILIACGGDDKKLHLLQGSDQKEIGLVEFEDIVWKCHPLCEEKVIASSYSFSYLDEKNSVEKIEFSSKICCVDEKLNIQWELKGLNVEDFEIFSKANQSYLLIGTTTGTILLLDPLNGHVKIKIKKKSCVNAVKFVPSLNIVLSCHDSGEINSFSLGSY